MASRPPVVSLVPRRFEDGGWGGVPRFDHELRRAIPGLVSLSTRLVDRLRLRALVKRHPDLVVITGNEDSLLVPPEVTTVVVHHGCAATHHARDPHWRGSKPSRFLRDQARMYRLPNRWYVAPARWTAEQFSEHHGVPTAEVLPSWVPPLASRRARPARPVVLGDWRDFNKGADVIPQLQAACPDLEFRPLRCTYATRGEVYGRADAWLTLSLSEGGSFSMSDAEVCGLPLVTTDVGNHHEYSAARVLPWRERDAIGRVVEGLREALEAPRGPSFFSAYSEAVWTERWLRLVERVRDERRCDAKHPAAGAR